MKGSWMSLSGVAGALALAPLSCPMGVPAQAAGRNALPYFKGPPPENSGLMVIKPGRF